MPLIVGAGGALPRFCLRFFTFAFYLRLVPYRFTGRSTLRFYLLLPALFVHYRAVHSSLHYPFDYLPFTVLFSVGLAVVCTSSVLVDFFGGLRLHHNLSGYAYLRQHYRSLLLLFCTPSHRTHTLRFQLYCAFYPPPACHRLTTALLPLLLRDCVPTTHVLVYPFCVPATFYHYAGPAVPAARPFVRLAFAVVLLPSFGRYYLFAISCIDYWIPLYFPLQFWLVLTASGTHTGSHFTWFMPFYLPPPTVLLPFARLWFGQFCCVRSGVRATYSTTTTTGSSHPPT